MAEVPGTRSTRVDRGLSAGYGIFQIMKAPTFTMRRLATDEAARRTVLDALHARPNGELDDVECAVSAYEAKYRMSSAEALAAIERGELRVTGDVEGWMMALRVRADLADLKAKAR